MSQIVFRMFDEIPKCYLVVWNAISIRYMDNKSKDAENGQIEFVVSTLDLFVCGIYDLHTPFVNLSSPSWHVRTLGNIGNSSQW